MDNRMYMEPASLMSKKRDKLVLAASHNLMPDKKSWKMQLLVCLSVMLAVFSLMMIVILSLILTIITKIQVQQMNQENINNELKAELDTLTMSQNLSLNLLANKVGVQDTVKNNVNLTQGTTEIQYTDSSYNTDLPVAVSCHAILQDSPSSPSGFYDIQSSDGSIIQVYCDMTRTCGNITGGWMRVAELDMGNPSSHCPPGLCLNPNITNNIRACQICTVGAGCSIDIYPVNVNYSRVCGRVIGYQYGSTDGFAYEYTNGFDGVQLAYGSPPMAIWTFAAYKVQDYVGWELLSTCPCANPEDTRIPKVPSAFGNHYFCDTGVFDRQNENHYYYTNISLWDGVGCTGSSTCCSWNNPPWFFRELFHTTNEDIRMSICRNEQRNTEDIVIKIVDILVQ